ncbi:GntR family transcriptional regulator [Mycolicibacterium agri]|uniref:GntR family transcriptional regulator n=1 Tax=Mycolicibacterium agri TaxID=36811 RepID=A0A2A7NGQ7_MYCAG|nr:GntR family transcriptional regulator [Mycolicibacterium agri]PEG42648.1 GntR family transcriptional regulator [Mycolicibacterium agri]GFG52622.1 GntR family transcriptional regulator [Mycolicibacterium agri]
MPSKPTSAAARAYEQLRSDILEGLLEPGTTLFEVEQSERLGVSRTPIREAFGRLVAEGLLDDRRGRGLVVTDVSDRDIDALFEMRICLEAQAARLAARRADGEVFAEFARDFQQWHGPLSDPAVTERQINEYYSLIRRFDEAVDAAASNVYLVDALDALRIHLARVRRKAGASPTRLAISALEHALIASAIANHDADLAAHATHVHLHNSLEHFRHDYTGLGTNDQKGHR